MEYNLHLLSNRAERLWHTAAGNALLSLIEINTFPNFIHNDQITSKVNIPFLTSVIERISDMEKSQSELIELGRVEWVVS